MSWKVDAIREDFPILQQEIKGNPLVYLDNAATGQKPRAVIKALQDYYTRENANVHRGVHHLSARATELYEGTRLKLQKFLNAPNPMGLIFVRGTTEGINLVAQTFARVRVQEGDEVLVSHMEHHSNIVPWQMLCQEKGANLKVIPINDRGEIELDAFQKMLNPRVKMLALVHVSNTLGTINPVKEMIRMAHEVGVPVLLDGAQAIPHMRVDLRDLDCDFYAFSSHKAFGPTGIGVLMGKDEHLKDMPPYQGGGDMIKSVSFEGTKYNSYPHRFEAGTPNIAGTIGLGAAVDYLSGLDAAAMEKHEQKLLRHATDSLKSIPGVRLIGEAQHKAAVVSFVVDGIHPHDMGTILDQEGIAIRTGHHCTEPLMDRFDVPATCRASFAFYNSLEEVDRLAAGIRKAQEVFA